MAMMTLMVMNYFFKKKKKKLKYTSEAPGPPMNGPGYLIHLVPDFFFLHFFHTSLSHFLVTLICQLPPPI